jgi:hypothetical protein
MAAPREVSEPLVQAYLARRALDYLVGFTLSPLLWRKVPGCRSAGRVQSVALRLVCEREKEYERFVPKEFWTVHATLQVHGLLVPHVSTSACRMATIGRGRRGGGGGLRSDVAARNITRLWVGDAKWCRRPMAPGSPPPSRT